MASRGGMMSGARDLLHRRWLPAAIAAVIVALSGIWVDGQNRLLHAERTRSEVLGGLGVIRAKLEGSINGNIALVKGLAATIATEPAMDQERFAALADSLLAERPQIRNIAAAPDLVIRLMYPVEGNEKAIGFDYRTPGPQRDAVIRARDTGRLVLAGPVDLRQGGRGFIARFPVFTRQEGGRGPFWGIVSAVILAERLYGDSGLLDPSLPYDVAIVGDDARGAGGDLFFGNADVLADDPVTADVVLPFGSWRIAAVPKAGWMPPPGEVWALRFAMALAGALIVVPILITGRLVDERREHIETLRVREIELKRLSQRLGLALDASRVGVWEFDIASDTLIWDERMNELYGYPRSGRRRVYQDWERRLSQADKAEAIQVLTDALEARGRYESQFRIEFEGTTRVIRAIGQVFESPDGAPKIVGVNWDVTADVAMTEALRAAKTLTEARNAELEAARTRIEHNALHDFLTGLPNRMYLDRVLVERVAACAAAETGIVLLQIDLDRFKEINDTLGHAAGDAMLVHVAAAIRAELSRADFAARIGGDEFVVVCRAERSLDEAQALAARLVEAMGPALLIEGREVRCGVSIGIASAFGRDADHRQLLADADVALYRAKNRGRNRCEIFTPALHTEVTARRHLADSVLRGVEGGEFVPYFQPQVDARTLRMTGVEALARWRHPTRGILGPEAFLALAEEINVLAAIDEAVLEQSLAEMRRWSALGQPAPRLSVNVSPRRIQDPRLLESLRGLGLPAGQVAFELAESICLDRRDERMRRNIEGARALGIAIDIDDFGTGSASVAGLMETRPEQVKIDRRLVAPILESEPQRRLVRSLVGVAEALGIAVLAEGVETLEHARLLRDLGCDALQGYAFARPMPAEALAVFARRRQSLAG